MIGVTLQKLADNHINPYLETKSNSTFTEPLVVLGNIAQVNDLGGGALNSKIVLTVVNIEEERMLRSPENYIRQGTDIKYKNPPVFLNLYVLFTSNFSLSGGENDYQQSLQGISYIIQFFQNQNVFTRLNAPDLPDGVEELIFDLKTLSFQDLNNMWGILGSKYLPSVLYKVRLLTIDEDFSQGDVLPINEILVNDKTWDPS